MLAYPVLANANIVSSNRILRVGIHLVVPYDNRFPIYERHRLNRCPDMVTYRMLQFPIAVHQRPFKMIHLEFIKNKIIKIVAFIILDYFQNKENTYHTSDFVLNLLYAKPSGAVHLIGNLAPACAV